MLIIKAIMIWYSCVDFCNVECNNIKFWNTKYLCANYLYFIGSWMNMLSINIFNGWLTICDSKVKKDFFFCFCFFTILLLLLLLLLTFSLWQSCNHFHLTNFFTRCYWVTVCLVLFSCLFLFSLESRGLLSKLCP